MENNAYLNKGELVAKRIKMLRQLKGLSQVDLAEIAGVTNAAVSRWEKGESSSLKTATIQRIIDKYPEISPAWFMGFDTPMLAQTDEERSIIEVINHKLERLNESQLKKVSNFIDDYII